MTKYLVKTATTVHILSLLFVSVYTFVSSAFAQVTPNTKTVNHQTTATFQMIFNHAVQNDINAIKKGLSATSSLSEYEKTQLTIMLGVINEDTDKTEEYLTKFTLENNDNPDGLIFAGVIWKSLSRQVGFFSFSSTYQKGLNAHIRAFELEPDNEHFRSLAGSSYTQIDSDNKPKQRALLAGYKNKQQGFHLVAQMDMAQNDRDHDLLVELAKTALHTSSTNVLVVERAAQAFWTAGNVEQAQQTFLKTCLLPAPTDIFRYTWQHSCYLAGYLALNETYAYQQGNAALTHLLTINKQNTTYNQEVQGMKNQIMKKLIE